jgi:hypothetical protein
MRDTKTSLLISGGLTAGGAGMVGAGALLFESQGETLLTVLLIFIGLAIAPLSFFWFISSAVSGARKEALEAGRGLIARWRPTASEWAAFRAQEARMIGAGRSINLLNSTAGATGDGEVIFAERGVIVDGDYQDLTPGGLVDLMGVEYLPGAPPVLEFAMRAQKPRGASGGGIGFIKLTLRVPIAGGDTREAMRVMTHYRKTTRRGVAIAMKKPGLTIGICLGVAAICAIGAFWGLSNRQTQAFGDAPLLAAVIGVIAGIGALILAAIIAYRVRVLKS